MVNVTSSLLGYIAISPAKVKDEQHIRYDELAQKVAFGELAHKPERKSRWSLSLRVGQLSLQRIS